MADKYIRVLAGATDKFEGGKLYEIKTLHMNPNFLVNGEYNQKFDIAVVELVNPIEYNDKVKPIEIISKRIEPGTPAVSGGWGNTIAVRARREPRGVRKIRADLQCERPERRIFYLFTYWMDPTVLLLNALVD